MHACMSVCTYVYTDMYLRYLLSLYERLDVFVIDMGLRVTIALILSQIIRVPPPPSHVASVGVSFTLSGAKGAATPKAT